MAAADNASALDSVVAQISRTWEDMPALQRELKPLREAARAAVKDAASVLHLLKGSGSGLRAEADQLLSALSQALKESHTEAPQCKAAVQDARRLIGDLRVSCRHRLKRLQRAVQDNADSLQYMFGQTTAAPGSSTALPKASTVEVQAAPASDNAASAYAAAEPPPQFLCPITCDVMLRPVLASDGHTYEEEALIRCLQLSCVSPMTREPLDPGYLQNTVLRQLIEEWRKEHVLDDPDAPLLPTAAAAGQTLPASDTVPVAIQQLPAAASQSNDLTEGHQPNNPDPPPSPTAAAARQPVTDGWPTAPQQQSVTAMAAESLEPWEADSPRDQIASLVVSCLSDPASTPDEQRQAARQLRYLALENQLLPEAACAAAPALVAMLADSGRLQGVQEASDALDQLASQDVWQPSVVDAALPGLCCLLRVADAACRGAAADALAKLARHVDLRRRIMDASLPSLVALLQKQAAPAGRKAAAKVLMHITDHTSSAEGLCKSVAAEALPALISLLQEASQGSGLAAGVIANLANWPSLTHRVYDQASPGLISLLEATACTEARTSIARAFRNLASDPGLRVSLACSVLPSLVSLLTDVHLSDGRTQAAWGIHDLALVEDVRQHSADRTLAGLVALIRDHRNPEGRNAAASAISILAADASRIQSQLIADRALSGLVALLAPNNTPEGRTAAASVISSVAGGASRSQCQHIADSALVSLVALVNDSSAPDGGTAAASAISRLAYKASRSQRQHIADQALSGLVALLLDGSNPPGATNAACAITALADGAPRILQQQLVHAAVSGLKALLRAALNPAGQEQAARAVNVLAATSDTQLRSYIFAKTCSALECLERDVANQAGSAAAKEALRRLIGYHGAWKLWF